MKKLLIIIFSILCLSKQGSVIDDYIWVNYQRRTAPRIATDGTYNIQLPCQAKIGTCRIKYSQIPDNWVIAEDNSLLVPKGDVGRPAAFVVKATMTNMFGDKIEADLVLDVQRDFFVVSDRKGFLNRYGYNSKNSVAKPLQEPRGLFMPQSYNIQGFPTIEQVTRLIQNQGVYQILTYLNELSSKYAPCPNRVSYLSQILKVLQNKIKDNKLVIDASDLQILTLQQNIANLQQRKRQQEMKQFNDKSYNQTRNKIKQLNSNRDSLAINQTKSQFLANSYLNNMKMLGVGKNATKQKSKEQIQLNQMEVELQQLNSAIQKALQKKKKLEQTMKIKKTLMVAALASKPIKLQPQDNQSQLLNLYQQKYRQYTEQALQSKLKIMQLDQQLKTLNFKLSSKNSAVQSLQQQLSNLKKRLSQKQSPSYTQLQQQLKNLNQIYAIGADNMKNRINMLSSTSCN